MFLQYMWRIFCAIIIPMLCAYIYIIFDLLEISLRATKITILYFVLVLVVYILTSHFIV